MSSEPCTCENAITTAKELLQNLRLIVSNKGGRLSHRDLQVMLEITELFVEKWQCEKESRHPSCSNKKCTCIQCPNTQSEISREMNEESRKDVKDLFFKLL